MASALSGKRIALALFIGALAWSSALYLHQLRITTYSCPSCAFGAGVVQKKHEGWQDPAALFIAIGGLAVAVGTTRRRTAQD